MEKIVMMILTLSHDSEKIENKLSGSILTSIIHLTSLYLTFQASNPLKFALRIMFYLKSNKKPFVEC